MTRSKKELAELFARFWKVYPIHVAKLGAERKFTTILRRGVDPEDIITGAARYRDDPNREASFTKHPTTWLNQGCWDDDPLPARGSNGNHRETTAERLKRLRREEEG